MSWQKLKELVHSMNYNDFEKLVARLLELHLKIPFVVARSGDQPRGDARSITSDVSMQAKLYTSDNTPNAKTVEGDIREAIRRSSHLQVYVLAVSRDAEQLNSTLDDIARETGLDIVTLELSGELSDIGALCVTFWEDIHHFFQSLLTYQNSEFLTWIEDMTDSSETKDKVEYLRPKLKDGIQTQKHVQEVARKYLLERFSTDKGFNPINLSQVIERKSLESKIMDWWETDETSICCLEGEEGNGKTWLAAEFLNSISEKENIVTFWLDSRDWKGNKSIFDLLYSCFKSIYPSYEQEKIAKLQNKPAKIWRKTLIVLDGANERNAIETAQRILSEYFMPESDWKDRICFLLTTRPLDNYPHFEKHLWDECHEISIIRFNDPELQEALTREGLQPNDLPDSLSDIARIPRYFQRCLELRDELGSFDVVTKGMVLLTDLLNKIEHSDPQIREALGWSRAEDPKEFFLHLAQQMDWDKIDDASERLGQSVKNCFSDYSKIRQDLEEQRIVRKAGLFNVKLSDDYVLLCWALYFSNLFDCTEFTGIENFAESFLNTLEPIPSEDLRTEALSLALQISAISPNPDISQDELSQKRAALMLAWFSSHNAQVTDEYISFWVKEDPDAYAQIVEFEFKDFNPPSYEESIIEPLAKIWDNKKDRFNLLASRLTKWLLHTYAGGSSTNRFYLHRTGQQFPRTKNDIQIRLSEVAISILSQYPDRRLLKALARCYAVLNNKGKLDENIGRLMRWGYTEEVLDNLRSLAEQSQHDELLLMGIYGLADCLCVNLRPSLEHLLPKGNIEQYSLVEQDNQNFNSFINLSNRIYNHEQLLTGDSPKVNANRSYYGLDCLAVRKDLPGLCGEDQDEIRRILRQVSTSPEPELSRDLLPWIAKYTPEGYSKFACDFKINALNPEYPPYVLGEIQELVFVKTDCERISAAILEMKECLAQGDDSSRQRASLLTEILLFSASEDQLIDWFKFLASHESLRKSMFTETLQVLLNELLPEPVVRLVRQKLGIYQSSLLDNYFPSNTESEKTTEEDFWWWIYLCISDNDENIGTWALENLRRRKSNVHLITFHSLYKATLDSNRFLSEILTDEKVRKHLFLKDGRFFRTPIYKGENSYSYEDLVSVLPAETVGSFLCSPKRRIDLSRWGKELIEKYCSFFQDAEVDFDHDAEMRFLVNPKVLRTWAEQNETDFLQSVDKYLIGLSESRRYHRALSAFTDDILCLLLRFQPNKAMKYYRQWKIEGGRTVYSTHYGVETFFAQLWQVEDCNLSEHCQLRREFLETRLNDEEIMFMTLSALAEGGADELWDLVTQEYLVSPYAKQRNLGVSILPWFGTCEAIKQLEQLKSSDSSKWVREHAIWAYEVAQQERSCQEIYWKALQTRDPFQISAVFEQMKPALSPIARWWYRHENKEKFDEKLQDYDPKLLALVERFWFRWENSLRMKSNFEVFGRKLREYCRGEKLPTIGIPRIAPWWKPTLDSKS